MRVHGTEYAGDTAKPPYVVYVRVYVCCFVGVFSHDTGYDKGNLVSRECIRHRVQGGRMRVSTDSESALPAILQLDARPKYVY